MPPQPHERWIITCPCCSTERKIVVRPNRDENGWLESYSMAAEDSYCLRCLSRDMEDHRMAPRTNIVPLWLEPR
jgi:hypothetical protein